MSNSPQKKAMDCKKSPFYQCVCGHFHSLPFLLPTTGILHLFFLRNKCQIMLCSLEVSIDVGDFSNATTVLIRVFHGKDQIYMKAEMNTNLFKGHT